MREVYLVDAVRSPIGKYGGKLAAIRPDDLLTMSISGLLARYPYLPKHLVDDVLIGCANQAGEDNRNIARFSALMAGLPDTVPGVTVNRLCGSGMQALVDGFLRIGSGYGDLIICGGVESMSRAPFVLPKPESAFQRTTRVEDTTFGWRFTNPRFLEKYDALQMGETAELLAQKYSITREEQDAFALQSHQRYFRALAQDRLTSQLIPLEASSRARFTELVENDEAPRQDTCLEKLAKLMPVFKKGGTVTAGNSSGINDGASVLLLASEKMVKQLQLQPLARIVSFGVAGVHPDLMGTGPIPATQQALKQAHLSVKELDLAEVNEAFAVQALVCMRELGLDPAKVNVNGGALAIGHPLGCSGARITGALAHELALQKKKYGLATMCIGVGQGISLVIENLR